MKYDKPEGLGSELADVIIRALDTATALGFNMESEIALKMAFNKTRTHRHGGKPV
jgi:NTP pyrophosphatase (non-canonical NTP hydrolase)